MFTGKKIFALSLVALMLVVLPGCGSTDKTDKVNDNKDNGAVVGTIESLLGMDKTQKCTWKGTDGETSVIYTDGEKTRVEVSGMTEEIDQTMLMVSDGEWQYSWMDGEKEGTKMNLKDLEEIGEDFEDFEDGDVEVEYVEDDFDIEEDEGEYSCENWKADSSYFVPASDVDFVDMAEQFKAMEDAMENLNSPEFKESMKALCDLVPASEKEECLADLQ